MDTRIATAQNAIATRATTTIFTSKGGLPESVLRAFDIRHSVLPLPGGITGSTYISGNLVLKRADDNAEAQWSSRLLSDPAILSPHYRIPQPIASAIEPERFVVDSWSCSLFVEGKSIPRTLSQWQELLTAARAFLATLKAIAPTPPEFLETRCHRWDQAAQVAFGERSCPPLADDALYMLDRLRDLKQLIDRLPDDSDPISTEPQLIHSDLAGNVLFAQGLSPAIIDFSPMWRPAAWAEAIVVSDALVEYGSDSELLNFTGTGKSRMEMLHKAMLFRVVSDWMGGEEFMDGMRSKWAGAIEQVHNVVSELLLS